MDIPDMGDVRNFRLDSDSAQNDKYSQAMSFRAGELVENGMPTSIILDSDEHTGRVVSNVSTEPPPVSAIVKLSERASLTRVY